MNTPLSHTHPMMGRHMNIHHTMQGHLAPLCLMCILHLGGQRIRLCDRCWTFSLNNAWRKYFEKFVLAFTVVECALAN